MKFLFGHIIWYSHPNLLRKMMPDGGILKALYPSPPSSNDEAILIPIRNSRPEDIAGLAWSRPDFAAAGHKIICGFSAEGKRRPGGEYIRCAICSSDHPKFLDGAVLWSPDGHLRLIGHVCAAKPEHFGEAGYRSLRKQRDQEELDAVALDWLTVNAEKVKSFAPVIQAVKACALHVEEQQKVFFRDVEQLAIQLANRARHYDGTLTVSEELSGARTVADASGALRSLYEDILIGTMIGAEFLHRPRHLRSRQLEGNLKALDLIPDGSGEQPTLTLIDQGGEQAVTVAAAAVFRALELALKIAQQCTDAVTFTREENLATLKRWGDDSRNPICFSLQHRSSSIEFTLADRSRAVIKTGGPRLPDVEPIRQVVASGLLLNQLLPKQNPSAI